MNRLHFLAIACIFILGGCGEPKVPAARIEPVIMNWSPATISMTSARAWAKEAERRLGTSDFTLLSCHGVTRDGEWWLSPDSPRKALRVEDVAWTLRNAHSSRWLVIVACNEGAHKIDTPDTLYARRIVYTTPDNATPMWPFRPKHYIGRIEDFTETTPRVRLVGER